MVNHEWWWEAPVLLHGRQHIMKMPIRVRRVSSSAYRASCPALPGCSVEASSREEAVSKVRWAMRGYVASFDVPDPDRFDLDVQVG